MSSFPQPSRLRDRDLRFNLAKVCTPNASAATGLTITETGVGNLRQTIFSFSAFSVATTDAGANGGHGASLLATFPESIVRILGVGYDVTMTAGSGGIADGAALVWSLGSVTNTLANETLTSTEADILPSVAATLVAGVKTSTGASTGPQIVALTDSSGGTASDTIPAQTGSYVEATQENTVASLAAKINECVAKINASQAPIRDGTTTAVPVYLNIAVPAADHSATADTVSITGDIIITWISQGDIAA